jgi:outer membrane protein insertion porin family
VFVERIDIVGNERTLDKVIRREMRLVEGDAFNTAKLRLSKDRIKDLDFFDKSDVTNVPSDTAPDRTVIKVDVSEKSTGELTFGIGYSTAYGAMINVGAGERNLLGTAQQISISGEFALLQAGGKISYTDPYFLDKRLAAGFDIFAQNTSVYESYAYATGTTGFDIRAGWMYNEHWRHDITYTASMTNVHDVQPGVSLYILDQQGVNTLSSIGHILTYDRRDSHTETKSGWYVYFGNDVAGLLGTEHFVRNSLGAGKYYTFADEWTLSLIASAGYMNPWGGHQVHINNLFFLGGNTMPGFSYGGISPRDRGTEDALGGVWDAVGNASLKLPLGLPKEYGVGARLFTYVGSIGGTIDPGKYGPVDQSSVPRVSSGIGVVWKSPMGPVDFDLAVPIVRQSYDKIRFFFFNFGQHF